MVSVVDVVNAALLEGGQRVTINSLNDGSVAANTASVLYTPKVQMLLRAAPWDFARKQVTLSQLKAQVVNGVVSTNPPPSPWAYEYSYPSDCLKGRFILPTAQTNQSLMISPAGGQVMVQAPMTTQLPFVVGTDIDTTGNPNKVILTNLYQAQLVYTADLSQLPNLWDSTFMAACTAYLAAWFLNAQARNKGQFEEQMRLAKELLDMARVQNGNESISNVDHTPDWLMGRDWGVGSWGFGGPALAKGWDTCGFPGGQFY